MASAAIRRWLGNRKTEQKGREQFWRLTLIVGNLSPIEYRDRRALYCLRFGEQRRFIITLEATSRDRVTRSQRRGRRTTGRAAVWVICVQAMSAYSAAVNRTARIHGQSTWRENNGDTTLRIQWLFRKREQPVDGSSAKAAPHGTSGSNPWSQLTISLFIERNAEGFIYWFLSF